MKILKHNWQWKLISLVIGILMWSYITAGVNPTQSLTISNIPVIVQNQEELGQDQLQITKMELTEISVRLTGKRNALGNVDRTNVTATIDASRLKEGTQSVPIEIHAPMNLLIEDSDRQMQVTVEKVVKRSRNVVVEQSGTLESGYMLQSLTVVPESIEVSGSQSRVDRVAKIVTKMDVSGLTADTSANIEVTPVDQEGNPVDGVELSLASVNVTASIAMQKTLPIKIQWTGDSPEGIRLRQATVSPDTVLVMGKKDSVSALSEINTMPIDRSKMTKDGLYPVTLEYPEGILPVNTDSQFMAQISLEALEKRSYEIPISAIQLENQENLTAKWEPGAPSISVEVEGYPKDLDTLKTTDIKITADLAGKSAGTQNLSLTVAVPEPFQVTSLSSPSLTATLQEADSARE